ncbi:hypothetical protein [Luteolibacter luteus]|uniref:Uncharacterized protein n=1 Tax=Luteolibacter luteus TaxID=2728835 RepID=A0A858RQ17_9BACT|nr:hypothetical protein [Luteolibacter luteus]QJE98972.1 hypothetical protein HHL09_25400 [Luteolibacter luteus]
MIRCSPRGICSWVFLLDGDGHHAETRFSWIGEQGCIVIDGEPFEVRKVGFFRGQWEMVGASGLIVRAKKTSAFRRSFELSTPHGGLGLLKSVSLFGRSMDLSGTAADCVIAPVHAFTRRATIEGEIRDLRIVVFAFWLTALIWRRGSAANTNGNAVVLR